MFSDFEGNFSQKTPHPQMRLFSILSLWEPVFMFRPQRFICGRRHQIDPIQPVHLGVVRGDDVRLRMRISEFLDYSLDRSGSYIDAEHIGVIVRHFHIGGFFIFIRVPSITSCHL